MKKLLHLLCAVFLLANLGFTQVVDTLWTRTYFPCEHWDVIETVVGYPWRGLLVAGRTVCPDGVSWANCGYVQRLDQSMLPVWTRTFGPYRIRLVSDLVVTEDGRIGFIGSGRNGRGRSYGVLDSDGQPLWISPFSSYHEYNMGLDICLAIDSGFVMASASEQVQDSGQIMIEHVSDSGAVIWRKYLSFSEDDEIRGLERMDGMYVVLCSATQSDGSFLFAEFLSLDGTSVGRAEIATAAITHPEDFVIIGDSLIAVMGTVWNSLETGEQTIISVIDASGNVRWEWQEPVATRFESRGLSVTPSGGLIVCGFDGFPDKWGVLLKFSSAGNLLWRLNIPAEFSDELHTVLAFGENECIAGGEHGVLEECQSYDDWLVGVGVVAPVASRPGEVIRSFSLSVFPNPFNSTVSIALDVPLHQEVTLALHDLLGREVAVIHRGILNSATISYTPPASLASGIYFLRAVALEHVAMQKIVLLK